MMGDSLRFSLPNKKLELRISAAQNPPRSRLLGSYENKSSHKALKCMISMKVGLVVTGDIRNFLLKTAVLEIVRRFSSANYPFIWHGLQALQLLCCPPFTWIQKWVPFTCLVKRLQTLSRPLLFLSIASSFFDQSESSVGALGGSNSDQASSASNTEASLQLVTQDTRIVDKVPRSVVTESWLEELYTELEKQGINIPERLNEDDLRRFYVVSGGDFARFLLAVKKTIRWRQKYTLLSPQELEAWAHLVFWHGSDTMQRPCLIIRIGLACSNLASNGLSQFVTAVVSQVEYGVLNLVSKEQPQLTVLMDCEGLTPFGFPVHTFRSCAVLLQDHYPNRLACLLVVRLPSIARVITQTVFQVLRPTTRQKLMIVGDNYRDVLSRYFEQLPPFLGGACSCSKCANDAALRQRNRDLVGGSASSEPTDYHFNGNVNGNGNVSVTSNIYVHASLDVNRERVKLAATVGVLLLWICVAFVFATCYQQQTLPWASGSRNQSGFESG